MRCKDCSRLQGRPYKRSHLIALGQTKISADEPASTWCPGERDWAPENAPPSFGTSAILPHAHPPQSKTIARLKANRSAIRVWSVILLPRRVIDALTGVLADVAFDGTADKHWPELCRSDGTANNSQSDYRRDDLLPRSQTVALDFGCHESWNVVQNL